VDDETTPEYEATKQVACAINDAADAIDHSGDVIAKAMRNVLISPNECDSNFEAANVVDGLFAIARALDRVARAIEGGKGAA